MAYKAEKSILKGIKKRIANKKVSIKIKSLKDSHKLLGIAGLRD